MPTIDMQQAKSSLSRLLEAIEQGRVREIIIVRNGRPAAKLVPMDTVQVGKRIGVAKGKFTVPDSIDTYNENVTRMILGDRQS